jgi:hypothetical protein
MAGYRPFRTYKSFSYTVWRLSGSSVYIRLAVQLVGNLFINSLETLMKMIRSGLAAVSLCFCAASVHAQQQTQASGATETSQPVQTVNVSGARRVHLEPQEYMAYEYEYSLSNRDTVRFSRRVGRFYVEIKPYPAVEIIPAAEGQFETRAGARLVFSDGGDVLDIDHYELLQVASGVTVTSLPVMALPGAPK